MGTIRQEQDELNGPDTRAISRRSLMGLGGGFLVTAATMGLTGCGSDGGDGPGFNASLLSNVATEIAADELAHVIFLRTAITNAGGTPVAKPAINLNPTNVNFSDVAQFLNRARQFEDVGVSAYAGAAPLISSDAILSAAARILATEAYHAGNIRYQVVERGISSISVDAQDQTPASNNFFPTDQNGLAIARTPAQVVAIVSPFFPNGLNGTANPGNDLEILNFALQLEYLEAEFYAFAVNGAGLANTHINGSGTQGATTGGARVNF
jgi:hypothetical protein